MPKGPFAVTVHGHLAMAVLDEPNQVVLFVCRFCGADSGPSTGLPQAAGLPHAPTCFAVRTLAEAYVQGAA